MLHIHPSAKISAMADIEESVRGSEIILEDSVVVDSFVKIKPAGGLGGLIVRQNSVINSGCVFYTGNGIDIGENVAIAANCTFAPTNHEYRAKNTLIRKQGFKKSKGGIRIGNDVWIGANCVILDGSIINDGVVVGAGSIVRGELDSYSIYVGNPLQKIGCRE